MLVPKKTPSNLEVAFKTVHGSKGLEADYVVIPRMTSDIYGFPSSISDDPVLQLAMPVPEVFPDAEERRLFYVALTRARRKVIIVTQPDKASPFIAALVGKGTADGRSTESPISVCPGCGLGLLVERSGRYGEFWGCSTFPACTFTKNIDRKRSDESF